MRCALLLLVFLMPIGQTQAAEIPASMKREFPKADFSIRSIDPGEIISGGGRPVTVFRPLINRNSCSPAIIPCPAPNPCWVSS